jgi:hypothetical protein
VALIPDRVEHTISVAPLLAGAVIRQQTHQAHLGRKTMSFERHHPNREVDRNLDRARDLRSAYLFAGLAAIAEFMARPWRARQSDPAPDMLELPAPPIGKQPV